MSQELIYTSAPTGLKPGSKGFCTVAMTSGLPTGWIDRLEPLSGYKGIFPLGDPKSDRNPVNFSHWRVTVSGKTKSVLSRVAFAGADYSGRSNKLAHHIVLESAEQAAGGPAWMLLKPGTVRTTWAGAPQQFAAGPRLPAGDRAPAVCTTWANLRGDAGWAGVLAESIVTDPAKPAYVIYPPGTDVLRLVDESLSLLPPAKRWDVTFSTFFTELPLNLTCAWRGVVAGTPAATEAMRLGPRALVIDLTKPAGAPPSGVYADAARAGKGPITAAGAHPSAPSNRVPPVTAPPADADDSGIAEIPFASEPASGAVMGGRKRLAATSSDLETEIQMGVLVAAGDSQTPQHVIVHRGVREWVLVTAILSCLLLGLAGSVGTYFVLHKRYQANDAEIARAKQQTINATKIVTDAGTERDDFKKRAELAEAKALSASEGATQMELGYKTQITNLQKDKENLTIHSADLDRKIDDLNKKLADLQNSNSQSQARITELQNELASLKNGGSPTISTPEDDGSQVSANAVPIDDKTTEITFPAIMDGGDPHVDLALPARCSNASGIKLFWPNGQDEFDVIADNNKQFHLSERVESPTRMYVQALLPGGVGMSMKDIVEVEVSLDHLTLTKKSSDNPSATSVAKAVQLALDDSAFIISTKNGGKDRIWRISLNRARSPAEADKSKNIFTKPSLPARISLTQIRFDGAAQGWKSSPDNRPGVFICDMSQNQKAEFSVSLSEPFDKEWQIAVDVTPFNNLRKQQSDAESEKLKAETAANEAADALKKKQDSHASDEKIQKAKEKKDLADAEKKTREDEASRIGNVVNEWRNKYDSLSHSFLLSLRIPNGVEIMRVQISLPQLPQ